MTSVSVLSHIASSILPVELFSPCNSTSANVSPCSESKLKVADWACRRPPRHFDIPLSLREVASHRIFRHHNVESGLPTYSARILQTQQGTIQVEFSLFTHFRLAVIFSPPFQKCFQLPELMR